MPDRSWNVYDRPASVGFGIDLASAGTSDAPARPPTRLKPTRPSFVKSRMLHESEKYARAGSIVSSTLLETTVSVPPR